MKKLQKGFTLIELLVVIAIIGILSGIVLASLSSARTRGENAALQSSLSNMRVQADLYASNNNGAYHASSTVTVNGCNTASSIFTASSSAGGLFNLITDVSGRVGGVSNMSCTASSSVWIVSVRSRSGTSAFCADSSGNSFASTTRTTFIATTTGICVN